MAVWLVHACPGGGGGGGALDLETTVRAAQNLAFKIGPLQCSEKMVISYPYSAFQQRKTTLTVHQ